ncbi:MAG: UMP kinase [Candidatus Aenigmatarchaeota archaeon]
MRIVFALGGSIICPKGLPDIKFLKRFSNFIKSLSKKNEIIIVAGGGKMTKDYIKTVRKLNATENLLDQIGILGTRMNAFAVIASLGKYAYPKVIENKEELEHAISSKKIAIMGGTKPGQTTDAVAAAAAKLLNADLLIIASNVDGVYDKDPKKYKNAKLFKNITAKEVYEMVKVKKHKAGPVGVLDQVAAKFLMHNKIKTIFVDGRDIKNLKNAIENKNFKGTIIE